MSELFTKENLFAFAEWIGENGYTILYKEKMIWDQYGNGIANSTQELFELFLKERDYLI